MASKTRGIETLAGELADTDPLRWPSLVCEMVRHRAVAPGEAALLEGAIMHQLVESDP
jgi:hypothetical protein